MKKSLVTAVALALAASIGFAQQQQPRPAAPAADPVVMAAGDITVKQSEFEAALKTLPAEYQSFAMGQGKRQFAEDYLRMKMLAAEGAKAGLDKKPEVAAQLALMRDNVIANAQLERIQSEIQIPDAELQKSYDANKSQYEQVKARHILVAFKGSPAANPEKPELTEEQAKAKAEEIRKKLVGGGKFEDLAKESDDTGSGARGGELGSFSRGQMVPEFEKAAFEGKVGEVLPVVRTQFGYHIIRVDQHTTTPFAEVKETLAQGEKQKKLQERLDALKASAKPTFNDTSFAPAAPPAPATPTAQPPAKP